MAGAERTAFGIALVGHVALFAVMSLGLTTLPKPLLPTTPAVDVQIVDAVALRDTTPEPATEAPAPSVAPEVGTQSEPPVAEPAPPMPQPAPVPPPKPVPPKPSPAKPSPAKPTTKPDRPSPASRPAAKPAAKPPTAPARPKLALNLASSGATARPGSTPARGARLGNDFLKGIGDRPSSATGQAPRAAAGAAAEAGLAREVLRQLKPFWKAPTGADAEQLRTALSIALNRDGSVATIRIIETTGQTPSNRGQVRLHQEAAVKAVRLAAPFVLPVELYDAWKVLEPVSFDKRLG